MVAERLSPALGVPVVVENRPGAGGAIGAVEVARSAPDGHTLFMATTGTQSANQFLYPNLPYDPERDFAPVTGVTHYPAGRGGRRMAARPDAPRAGGGAERRPTARGLRFVRQRLAHPPGRRTVSRETGTKLVHVPYRGQGAALNDLVAGLVKLMFPSVADVLGHLRGGRLAALAVMNSTRMSVLPDVPTAAEAGHPGLESAIWTGLYVRAGTPTAAVARLNAEVVRVLETPELRDRLVGAGFEVRPGTPAALADLRPAKAAAGAN
jgi:tripartite-type tricarboxylate transporter receptor subunit TctC